MPNNNLYKIPENLPIPQDDGACAHLITLHLPTIALQSTAGRVVELANLPGYTVIYCYPRTGQPNVELPQGWDEIPGARGCTPQSCAFRDHYQELQAIGTQVFGLSTQSTHYQQEVVKRLHLPFELLSDSTLDFATQLQLPTFEVAGMTLIRRLTLITFNSEIKQVFYPIFPPEQNAIDVINWFSQL